MKEIKAPFPRGIDRSTDSRPRPVSQRLLGLLIVSIGILVTLIVMQYLHDRRFRKSGTVYKTVRIKVLENSTISYVRLDTTQLKVLHDQDTIWVNLATHLMDDTCNTTMGSVVYLK